MHCFTSFAAFFFLRQSAFYTARGKVLASFLTQNPSIRLSFSHATMKNISPQKKKKKKRKLTSMAPIDTMLTWGMEMELNQIIFLLSNRNRIVMGLATRGPINFDSMAIEMGHCIFDWFIIEYEGLFGTVDETREGLGVDVNGGLLHACLAGHVGWVQEAPVIWSCLIATVLFFFGGGVFFNGERRCGKGRGSRRVIGNEKSISAMEPMST
jgi:hypothetical protein